MHVTMFTSEGGLFVCVSLHQRPVRNAHLSISLHQLEDRDLYSLILKVITQEWEDNAMDLDGLHVNAGR